MRLYPKPKNRMAERPAITDEDRRISRLLDFDYFDGDRRHGYGGFSYHPRFWTETVDLITNHYGLPDGCSILDVGCAKGFMLKDFSIRLPNAQLAGIDVSPYAIEHAEQDIQPFLQVASRCSTIRRRPFDLIISINTIHNLDREDAFEHSRKSEGRLRKASWSTAGRTKKSELLQRGFDRPYDIARGVDLPHGRGRLHRRLRLLGRRVDQRHRRSDGCPRPRCQSRRR